MLPSVIDVEVAVVPTAFARRIRQGGRVTAFSQADVHVFDGHVAVIASAVDDFTGFIGDFEGDVISLAECAEVKQSLLPTVFTSINARAVINGRGWIEVRCFRVGTTVDVTVSIAATTGAFFKFALGSQSKVEDIVVSGLEGDVTKHDARIREIQAHERSIPSVTEAIVHVQLITADFKAMHESIRIVILIVATF